MGRIQEPSNIAKPGVDFAMAARIFVGAVMTSSDTRFPYGEQRDLSIGKADQVVVLAVVHTQRNGLTRIISARRANKRERARYEAAL